MIQEWRGNTVHRWTELHEQYGEVVRIAPDQLSYISTAAWRDIYGVRGSTALAGEGQMLKEELVFPGDDFEFFAPAKPMISCDPASHARHRRAVAPAFSDRALRTFEPVILRFTDLLLEKLEEEQHRVDVSASGIETSTKGKTTGINIIDWFHFAMFDITSALVFGKPFGNLEQGRYHAWVARVFPGMKLVSWSLVIAAVPGLGRLISWFLPRRMVDEARRHMQSIVDMTDSRCQAQKTSPPHQADFMSYILPNLGVDSNLLEHKGFESALGPHGLLTKGQNAGLSGDELYLNAQLLCIAGSETTASLLAAAVSFLSRPEYQQHRQRLVSELRSQFGSAAEITPSSLNPQQTPYLVAVLNECLRLFPPGAINMPRTVPAGGATIDGSFVPGGSVVGIAQYAAYRYSRHWTDPLKFAPERWLPGDAGAGRYASDRRDVFKPFSHGPRNCVGQGLAIAECRFIAARLFWGYHVEVLPNQEDWMHQRTFLSWEKPPLMVQIRKIPV